MSDIDEETKELMEQYGLDEEEAERVQKAMEEFGVDEEEAIELAEFL